MIYFIIIEEIVLKGSFIHYFVTKFHVKTLLKQL